MIQFLIIKKDRGPHLKLSSCRFENKRLNWGTHWHVLLVDVTALCVQTVKGKKLWKREYIKDY